MIYLIPAAIAWVTAQGLKYLFHLAGHNRRIYRGTSRAWLVPSGGMPSAHSATVAAFAATVALVDGVESGLFALSLLVAAIVMYDSVRVRYSSGRQGDLLNSLLTEVKSGLVPVRVAHGHTGIEAVVGAMIGVVVGIIVFFTTK